MQKPVRHIRAGQLPPTDIPQLHRVDLNQLQPGGIYFSEPPEHVSTDESRKVRELFSPGDSALRHRDDQHFECCGHRHFLKPNPRN